jgi:hypothetical protein
MTPTAICTGFKKENPTTNYYSNYIWCIDKGFTQVPPPHEIFRV